MKHRMRILLFSLEIDLQDNFANQHAISCGININKEKLLGKNVTVTVLPVSMKLSIN